MARSSILKPIFEERQTRLTKFTKGKWCYTKSVTQLCELCAKRITLYWEKSKWIVRQSSAISFHIKNREQYRFADSVVGNKRTYWLFETEAGTKSVIHRNKVSMYRLSSVESCESKPKHRGVREKRRGTEFLRIPNVTRVWTAAKSPTDSANTKVE